MAIVNVLANGNWSAAGTWTGGVPPGPGDDVYANGKAVTINQTITVNSLNTGVAPGGGLTGGSFTLSPGFTINANIYAGSSTCVVCSTTASTYTVNGNISGGVTSNTLYGVNFTATGTSTLNVTGNVVGGVGGTSCFGINASGASNVLNITGNVTGGIAASAVSQTGASSVTTILGNLTAWIGGSSHAFTYGAATSTATVTGTVRGGTGGNGISQTSSSTLVVNGDVYAHFAGSGTGLSTASSVSTTINGDCYAGDLANAVQTTSGSGSITINGDLYGYSDAAASFYPTAAVYNDRALSLTITGNVYGGTSATKYGIYFLSGSTSVVTIHGGVYAGAVGPGIYQNASGGATTFTVNGPIVASEAAMGIWCISLTPTLSARGPFVSGDTGRMPFSMAGLTLVRTNASQNHFELIEDSTLEHIRLSTPDAFTDIPDDVDVRSGVAYATSDVGTMDVPDPSDVASGVAVDDTVGTATLVAQDVWDLPRSSVVASDSIGERLKNVSTVSSTGDQVVA